MYFMKTFIDKVGTIEVQTCTTRNAFLKANPDVLVHRSG